MSDIVIKAIMSPTPVIRPSNSPGLQGPRGWEVQVEYSVDGESWHTTPTSNDYYVRFSTDEGTTWGTAWYIRGEQGEQGATGETGATGATIASVAIVGTDIVFTKSDASTVTLTGAVTTLKGDAGADGTDGATGASIISAAFSGSDIVFTKDDANTVTLADAVTTLKGDTGATGETGATGDSAPEVVLNYSIDGATLWHETYTEGDLYVRVSTDGESTWSGAMKFIGDDGDAGADGTDGATILSDAVDPTTEGKDGDFYLNTTSWDVFKKISGEWSLQGNIKGASGEGSGDVVGPEGATAGNLATFSGTSGKIIQDSGSKVADFEPAIGAKGTAFNKNFGSSAGDVCQGNDSRLSDARTPTTHGNDKHSSTYITGTTRFLNVVIDGGGEAIETGIKCDVVMPACTIVGAYLLADQSGSIKIDLWKDSYANFPPTNDDSICGGNEPEISTATKDSDTTLTDWTTSVSDGDIIRVNVDSCTTIERCTLSLKITT